MTINIISAISLFVALLGVSINALCTRPYTGDAHLGGEKPRSELPGKTANFLIVLGTLGQLFAVILLLC